MKYSSARERGFSPIFILFLGLIIVVGIGLVFLFTAGPKSSQKGASNTNISSPSGSPQQQTNVNPLINSHDVDGVKQDYARQLQKQGKTAPVQPKFDYQLAPELNNKESFLSIRSAFAASTCSIDSAPSTIPVYTLKAHWTAKEASDVAKEFNITAPVASMPADGGGFQYFFSAPLTDGFLSLYEASGMYTYHAVLHAAGNDNGLAGAERKSDNERKKYGLYDGFTKLSGGFDASVGSYVFNYRKDWDLFPMVDTNKIKALGSGSVCGIVSTQSVNTATLVVSIDDKLSRVINDTRKITAKKTLPRELFTDAFAQYHAHPPVDPIVVGDTIAGGTVTIDEVTLVWYELGPNFAQTAYIPMYLTSGSVVSGTQHARVFTLFPAVSMKELVKSGVIPADEYSLKLDTFNPKPPKPDMIGCPGNTVDYTVSCSDISGGTVCNAFMGIKPDDDPNNICADGCKSKDGTVTAGVNEDPCKLFLEQNNMPTNSYHPVNPVVAPAGTYSCVLNGCPC